MVSRDSWPFGRHSKFVRRQYRPFFLETRSSKMNHLSLQKYMRKQSDFKTILYKNREVYSDQVSITRSSIDTLTMKVVHCQKWDEKHQRHFYKNFLAAVQIRYLFFSEWDYWIWITVQVYCPRNRIENIRKQSDFKAILYNYRKRDLQLRDQRTFDQFRQVAWYQFFHQVY